MRRMPSGQSPARRSGPGGRTSARGTARPTIGVRVEPRAFTTRASTARAAESARSANRPAAARRAALGGAVKRITAPHPRGLTRRATVLLLVLAALALGYAYPVRVYLSQQSDIARMEAAQAAQRRKISDLTDEVAKWQDDEYVRIQARRRLYYVYPGEIPLVVLLDDAGAARDAGANPNAAKKQDSGPWYGKLWSSIEVANRK
jgi:cell division protein FtsB